MAVPIVRRPAILALGVLAALLLTVHSPLSAQTPKAQPPRAAAAAGAATTSSQTPPADAAFRLKAWDTFVSMRGASPFKDLKWQFLGPTNISGRSWTSRWRTARAGRVSSTPPRRRAASGRPRTRGRRSSPSSTRRASVQGGNVEVAPSDPNIIWFGTGEANIFRSSNAGVGHLQVGRRGQDLAAHGPRLDPHHRPHRHSPDQPRHRLRRGRRARVDRQRGPRRLQDDRRRQDLGEGALRRREDRRQRSRDGSDRSERALRDDLAAHPPEVERPAHAARLHRQRHPQDDRTAARPGRRSTRGCRRPTAAAASASTSRARTRTCVYAFVDNYEIARQAKPGELDSYGRQKAGTIKGAEIYRSDNKGQTWRKVSESNAYMEGAAATYGWVFAQVRVDPTNENVVYFHGADAQPVDRRRQDVQGAARHAQRSPRALDRPGQPRQPARRQRRRHRDVVRRREDLAPVHSTTCRWPRSST